MKKIVGVTFGKSTTSECQINFNEMSGALLWDFVIVDGILCQITKIERTEELTVAHLRILGIPNEKRLESPRLPPDLGSNVYKAPKSLIKKSFGFKKSGIFLGSLHRYPDIKIYATHNDLMQRHLSIIGTTGSGKCLQINEPIIENGLSEIGHIQKDDEVECIDDSLRPSKKKVLNKTNVRKDECYKITSDRGYWLEGTKEHKFLVLTKNGFEWKEMGGLNVDEDYVCIQRGGLLKSREIQKFPSIERSNCSYAKKVNFPQRINEDWAYFIGLYTGDGVRIKGYGRKPNTSKITTGDKQIKDFLVKFGREISIEPTISERKSKNIYWNVSFSSVDLCKLLIKLGLDKKSTDRRVPEIIKKSSPKIIGSYLKGLFDADCHVGIGNIDYSTSSEKLGREVHILLLGLGIVSYLTTKKTSCKLSYRIQFSGDEVKRYLEVINFKLDRKRKKAEIIRDKERNPNKDIVPYQSKNIKILWEKFKDNRLKRECESLHKFLGQNDEIVPIRTFNEGAMELFEIKLQSVNGKKNRLIKSGLIEEISVPSGISVRKKVKNKKYIRFIAKSNSRIKELSIGRRIKDELKNKGFKVRTLYSYMLNDIKSHRNPSKKNLKKLIECIDESKTENEMSLIANSNLYFDKIKSIEKTGIKEVVDIEVEDLHNYVAGGFVVHNSSAVRCIIEDYIDTGIPIVVIDLSGEYTTLREANIEDFDRLLDYGLRPEVINSKIEIYSPIRRKGCKLLKVSTTNLSVDEISKLNSKYLSQFTPSQLNLLNTCIKKLQKKRVKMASAGVNWEYEISDIKELVDSEGKNASTIASLTTILENIENMDIFSKAIDDEYIDIAAMARESKCHVVNLSYLEEQSEKEIIVSKILTDIYEIKKDQLMKNKVRPIIIVLDEAQNWIPQSSTTHTTYIVKKCITEGRKLGIGMIVASVRPQSLSKDILSQTKAQIFFRLTNDNDIDWIGRSFESADKTLLSQLPQLRPGEGILSGIGKPIRIQFRPPKTRHGGKSVSFDGKNKLI